MGKTSKPPLSLLGVSLLLSLVGFLSGLILGGSLVGYGASLLATVLAFLALYVDRQRQMSRDYDYGYPWFRYAPSAVYVLGAVGTVIHIVRYAIELGNA